MKDAGLLFPILLAATLPAYLPALDGGVLWDDAAHITRADLRPLSGLWRIWFQVGATQQYYPLAHSAFWLLHRVWGDNTVGYHLVNVALHAASSTLLVLILRRLKVPGALLAGAIFALHPIQVESVAWMTELKNTLSGVFYLAAAWIYLRFDAERQSRQYVAAFALFMLAVLTKTVTATLPAALLVVFWWQRGRIRWREDAAPLVPFLVVGGSAGVVTAWMEHEYIGAQGVAFAFTPVERCLIAGRAIWFYLGKIVWPADLIFIYPRWTISQADAAQYLYPAGVLLLLGAAWWWRTRSRAPLAALLFFIGTLSPALGFVNVYPFRYSFVADHFEYLAGIGIIALAAAGLTRLLARSGFGSRAAAATLLVAIVVPLAVLTFDQSRQYSDIATLYRTTIDRDPQSWMALNNLAELELHGSPSEVDDAMALLQRAIGVKPEYPEAHMNLGVVLQYKGRFVEAASEYEQVLDTPIDSPKLRQNLAMVLVQAGRGVEALPFANASVAATPQNPEAHFVLGNALQQVGRLDDAIAEYRLAAAIRPDYPEVHGNLGALLLMQGRLREAIAECRETVRLMPNAPMAHANLAQALEAAGETSEAQKEEALARTLAPGGR